jgi:hypothetical protein
VLLLSLLWCKLPDPQVLPEPTWKADCDGWECPGATGVAWGETWAVCDWECSAWDGAQGVDVSVYLYADADGCWYEDAVGVSQRDCSWLSY